MFSRPILLGFLFGALSSAGCAGAKQQEPRTTGGKRGDQQAVASPTAPTPESESPSPSPDVTPQVSASGVAAELIGGEEVVVTISRSTCPEAPGLFWTADGPPRAYRDGAGRVRLSVPHYLAYSLVGTTLDNVRVDCSRRVLTSSQNADPTAFDDFTWPWSPYRLPDGRYMSVNHHEFHGWAHGIAGSSHGDWYPALTLSLSTDGGVSFPARVPAPQAHVIARPAGAYVPGALVGGYSDPTNILRSPADGSYYMIAMWKEQGSAAPYSCLARATDPANAESWRAFDGTGFTLDMRTGVACKHIIGDATKSYAPGSLTWSDTLQRPVYLTFGQRDGQDGLYAFIAQTDDLTQWSVPSRILTVTLPWHIPTPDVVAAYPSFLDPDATGQNFDSMSDTPYVYYIRWRPTDPTITRSVIRQRVKLQWSRP